MEKQLRAERDKRAAILTAEGLRQSQILTAEGAKQSTILTAEGQRQANILLAEGQAKAIDIVFTAIHEGHPDPELLAYQYLQALPKIAEGKGSKVWIIPSELTKAMDGLASAFVPTASHPASEATGEPLPTDELHDHPGLAAAAEGPPTVPPQTPPTAPRKRSRALMRTPL
jgi:hypothetical protein